MDKRFNPKKLEKLNNPARLEMIPPEYIWKVLAPNQHADKVEIGAGTGLFSRAFQKLSGEGRTTAVDVSDEMIEWMKDNITRDFPEILPVKIDGVSLPLPDNSADIVYMITLYHELDDQEGMLAEARRILRKGGRIFIVDWNMNNLEWGPSAEIRCSAELVAGQLEDADFNDIRIDRSLENFFLVTASG